MLTHFISRRSVEYVTVYRLCFYRSDNSGGFSFDCDRSGNVDESKLAPEGLANFRNCEAGAFPHLHRFVDSHEERRTTPAVIRCQCGKPLTLCDSETVCNCGREFNLCGQLLAPRSQWGEETGELGTF